MSASRIIFTIRDRSEPVRNRFRDVLHLVARDACAWQVAMLPHRNQQQDDREFERHSRTSGNNLAQLEPGLRSQSRRVLSALRETSIPKAKPPRRPRSHHYRENNPPARDHPSREPREAIAELMPRLISIIINDEPERGEKHPQPRPRDSRSRIAKLRLSRESLSPPK